MKRIGCVSYLNSRPLVWGLDDDPAVQITYEVPARLLDLIVSDQCDIALLPIIDYQRAPDLAIVPVSCIGADGPVYTVRLFSRVPIDQVRRVYFDTDSHTSVALCRIILKHEYNVEPLAVGRDEADAILLIGDKVVIGVPPAHPYELDLAEAWRKWTGLPFVFAAWMAREGRDLADVPDRLRDALARGMQSIQQIIETDALPRHWPADVARLYLTELLKFPLDLSAQSPQRRAIELFHQQAHGMGLTSQCRPLKVWRGRQGEDRGPVFAGCAAAARKGRGE